VGGGDLVGPGPGGVDVEELALSGADEAAGDGEDAQTSRSVVRAVMASQIRLWARSGRGRLGIPVSLALRMRLHRPGLHRPHPQPLHTGLGLRAEPQDIDAVDVNGGRAVFFTATDSYVWGTIVDSDGNISGWHRFFERADRYTFGSNISTQQSVRAVATAPALSDRVDLYAVGLDEVVWYQKVDVRDFNFGAGWRRSSTSRPSPVTVVVSGCHRRSVCCTTAALPVSPRTTRSIRRITRTPSTYSGGTRSGTSAPPSSGKPHPASLPADTPREV
jgi:hypothetical protein